MLPLDVAQGVDSNQVLFPNDHQQVTETLPTPYWKTVAKALKVNLDFANQKLHEY
jgi:hypothetical protein